MLKTMCEDTEVRTQVEFKWEVLNFLMLKHICYTFVLPQLLSKILISFVYLASKLYNQLHKAIKI